MFWKKKEERPVEVAFKGGEVEINPDTPTRRARNRKRIQRLEAALAQGKNKGNPDMERELKKRRLLEEAAKLDEEG